MAAITLENGVILELHRESYPGKRAWLKNAENYLFQDELKSDAQFMNIEQTGILDCGSLKLYFVAYKLRDEENWVTRVIRHYYAYQTTRLEDEPPTYSCEYWTESYNLEEILEKQEEDLLNGFSE